MARQPKADSPQDHSHSSNLKQRRPERETDVSAEPHQAEKNPRLPGAHGDPGRPLGHQATPEERTEAPRGLTRSDQRLPRSRRLLHKRDFERVFKEGKRATHPRLWLYARVIGTGATESKDSRVGLIVGKSVGTAVVRARTRRRLREVFRQHRTELQGNYDLVLRARPGIDDLDAPELYRIFIQLCRQAGIRITRADPAPRPSPAANEDEQASDSAHNDSQ